MKDRFFYFTHEHQKRYFHSWLLCFSLFSCMQWRNIGGYSLGESRAHHNKGSHLGNTRSRHLETVSSHCHSIMLFIFVQSLKREPVLLNAYQVPIAICSCSCMAIKKPRVSKRSISKTCLPGRSHSHPKPVPCMPVFYNMIKSRLKLEVKLQFWTYIYVETEIC